MKSGGWGHSWDCPTKSSGSTPSRSGSRRPLPRRGDPAAVRHREDDTIVIEETRGLYRRASQAAVVLLPVRRSNQGGGNLRMSSPCGASTPRIS